MKLGFEILNVATLICKLVVFFIFHNFFFYFFAKDFEFFPKYQTPTRLLILYN